LHGSKHRLKTLPLPHDLLSPARIIRNTRLVVRVIATVVIERFEQAVGINNLLPKLLL